MSENKDAAMTAAAGTAPDKGAAVKPKKKVSPATQKLKDIVAQSYADAWEAKKRGEPVGWSTSKFPCEIYAAFGLSVVYPENLAAAVAAQHDGERMCGIAEDLGYDADLCAYERINLALAHGHELSLIHI